MIKYVRTNRGGLIRTVLIVIAILLVLSYFGINLRSVVDSPTGQSNFAYVQQVLLSIWNVIKGPVLIVWNIFLTYIWNPAMHTVQSSGPILPPANLNP